MWKYWLLGPCSLPVWLPVLSGVQWHSSFSGPCPWWIWLVCSEWVLPTSVRWVPGREEWGQTKRVKTGKWCWELTWEGRNWLVFGVFQRWSTVTWLYPAETGQVPQTTVWLACLVTYFWCSEVILLLQNTRQTRLTNYIHFSTVVHSRKLL